MSCVDAVNVDCKLQGLSLGQKLEKQNTFFNDKCRYAAITFSLGELYSKRSCLRNSLTHDKLLSENIRLVCSHPFTWSWLAQPFLFVLSKSHVEFTILKGQMWNGFVIYDISSTLHQNDVLVPYMSGYLNRLKNKQLILIHELTIRWRTLFCLFFWPAKLSPLTANAFIGGAT